jgi:hypothetical protein
MKRGKGIKEKSYVRKGVNKGKTLPKGYTMFKNNLMAIVPQAFKNKYYTRSAGLFVSKRKRSKR